MEEEGSEAECGDPAMTKLLNYFETMEASGSQSKEVCKYNIMIDSLLETNMKLKTINKVLQDRNKELQERNKELQKRTEELGAENKQLKGCLGKCRMKESSPEEEEEHDKSEAGGSKGAESAVVSCTLSGVEESEMCPAESCQTGAQLQEGLLHKDREEADGAIQAVPGAQKEPQQVQEGQENTGEQQKDETVPKQPSMASCRENNDCNMDGQSSETLHNCLVMLNNESHNANGHSHDDLTLTREEATSDFIDPAQTERSAFRVVYDMMRELSMQAVSGTLQGSNTLSDTQRLTVDTIGGTGDPTKPVEDSIVVTNVTAAVSAMQDSCSGKRSDEAEDTDGCRRTRLRSRSRGKSTTSSALLQDATPVQEEHQDASKEDLEPSTASNDQPTKTWDQTSQTNIQKEDRVVELPQGGCHSIPELSDFLCSPEKVAELTEEYVSDLPKAQTLDRRRKKTRRRGRKPVIKDGSIVNISMSSRDVKNYLQTHHVQEETRFRTDCSGESPTKKRSGSPVIDAESALRAVMVISNSLEDSTDCQAEKSKSKGTDSAKELVPTVATCMVVDRQEERQPSEQVNIAATNVCPSQTDSLQQRTGVDPSTDGETWTTNLSRARRLEQERYGSKMMSDDTDVDTLPAAPKRRGRGRPPKKRVPKDKRAGALTYLSDACRVEQKDCVSKVTSDDTDLETSHVEPPKRRGRGRPRKKRPPADINLHEENNGSNIRSNLHGENNKSNICRRLRSLSKEKTENCESSISSRLRSRSRETPGESRTELFRSDDSEQEVVRDSASSSSVEDSQNSAPGMSQEVSSMRVIPAFSHSLANENTDNAIEAGKSKSLEKDSVEEAAHKATTNVDGDEEEQQDLSQIRSQEMADVCRSDAIREVTADSLPVGTVLPVDSVTETIDMGHKLEELRAKVPLDNTGEIAPKPRKSLRKYECRKPQVKASLDRLRARSNERYLEEEPQVLGQKKSEQGVPQNTESLATAVDAVSDGVTNLIQLSEDITDVSTEVTLPLDNDRKEDGPTTTSYQEVLRRFPDVLAKSPVVMIKRLEMTSQTTRVCESEPQYQKDSGNNVSEELDPEVTTTSPSMQESAQRSLHNFPTPESLDESEHVLENKLCHRVKARKAKRESSAERRNDFPRNLGMTRAWTKAEVIKQIRQYNLKDKSLQHPYETAHEEVHQETKCRIDVESALTTVTVIQKSSLPPGGNAVTKRHGSSSDKCTGEIDQWHTVKHNKRSSTLHEEDQLSHSSAGQGCSSEETLAPDVGDDAERRENGIESLGEQEVENHENGAGIKPGTLKIRVRLCKSKVDGKIRAKCIDTAASGGDQKGSRESSGQKPHVKRKMHVGIAELQKGEETLENGGMSKQIPSSEVQQVGKNASLSKMSVHAQKQRLCCTKELSGGRNKAAVTKRLRTGSEGSEGYHEDVTTKNLRRAKTSGKSNPLEREVMYKLKRRDSKTAEQACTEVVVANGQTCQTSDKRKGLRYTNAVAKRPSGGSMENKTGVKEPVVKTGITKVASCDRNRKRWKTDSESIPQTTADEQCHKPTTGRHQEEIRRTLGYSPSDTTIQNKTKKDFGSELMLADCAIEKAERQVGKKTPSQKSLQPRKKRRVEAKNPSTVNAVEKVGKQRQSTDSQKQSNKAGTPGQDQMQGIEVVSPTGTDSTRGSNSEEQWYTVSSGGCNTSKTSEDQWWRASSEQRTPTDAADDVFWSPGADDVGAEVEVPFSPVKGKNPSVTQATRDGQLNRVTSEGQDSAQRCKKVASTTSTSRKSTRSKLSANRKKEPNKSRGQTRVKGKSNASVKGKDSSTDATPLLSTDSKKQPSPEKSDMRERQPALPLTSNCSPQFTEAGQKVQVVFTSVQSPAMPASLHGDSPLSPWKQRPPVFSSTKVPRMAPLAAKKTSQKQCDKQKAGKRKQAKEKPANNTVRNRRKSRRDPTMSQEEDIHSAAFQETSAEQQLDAVSGKDAMNALNCISLQKTGDSVGSCSQQSNMSLHMQLTPRVKVLGPCRTGGNGSSQTPTQLAEQCYPDPLLTMGCNKVMLENSVRGHSTDLQDFGNDSPVVNMNATLPAVSQAPQFNSTVSPTALSLLTFRSEQAIFTNMPLDTGTASPLAVYNNNMPPFDTVTSLPDISYTLGKAFEVLDDLEGEKTAMQRPLANPSVQKESIETSKKKQSYYKKGQADIDETVSNTMPFGKDVRTAANNSICDTGVPVIPETQQRDLHPLGKISQVVQDVPTSPSVKRKLRELVDSPPKEKQTDNFPPVPVVMIDGKEKVPICRLPPGKNPYSQKAVLPGQSLQQNAPGHNLLVLANASDLVERLYSPTKVDVNRNNCQPTPYEKQETKINRESARELSAKVTAALCSSDSQEHAAEGSAGNPETGALMAGNLVDTAATQGVDQGNTTDILEEAMLQITGNCVSHEKDANTGSKTVCTSSDGTPKENNLTNGPQSLWSSSTSSSLQKEGCSNSDQRQKHDSSIVTESTYRTQDEGDTNEAETGKDEFVGRLPAGPPIRTSSRPVDSCTSVPTTTDTDNSMSAIATDPVLPNFTTMPSMVPLTIEKTSQSQTDKQNANKSKQAKEKEANNTVWDSRERQTDPTTSQEQDIISAAFRETLADQLLDSVSGTCEDVTAPNLVPPNSVVDHPALALREELAESFDSVEVEVPDVPEQAELKTGTDLKTETDNNANSAEKKEEPEASSSAKPDDDSTHIDVVKTSEEFCDAQSHTTSLDYSPDSDDNWENMETSESDVQDNRKYTRDGNPVTGQQGVQGNIFGCVKKPSVGSGGSKAAEVDHVKRNMNNSSSDVCQEPPSKVRRTLLIAKNDTSAGLPDVGKLSVTDAVFGPPRGADFGTIRQKSPELSDSPLVSSSSNSHGSTQLGSVVEKPSGLNGLNGGTRPTEKKTSPGSLASLVKKGNMKLKKLKPPRFLAARTTAGSAAVGVANRNQTDRPTQLQHGTQQGNGTVQSRDRTSASTSQPALQWVKETDQHCQQRMRRLEQEVQTFVKDSSQQEMKVRLTTNDELMKIFEFDL
ncbi:uncharacterized protein LOC118428414 isoform X2 [Branchiostoma floridae]|uniref:Uncharacterized protein LOC118428414 isoform X2 n=1 Tax=Branchiostoma floridae TaxID=7739 RepID=A0A9J7M504_BRAFL|nr:uncharacterized protein LOC118428414 isoform X2 [Branchiostoma floridae]